MDPTYSGFQMANIPIQDAQKHLKEVPADWMWTLYTQLDDQVNGHNQMLSNSNKKTSSQAQYANL